MMNQSEVTGREVIPTNASNSTQNYDLPLFVDGDKPSWDVDFNGAMNKIDTVMNDNAQSTSSINSTLNATQDRVTRLETRADNNDTVVDNLNTLTGQHSTDISSLQTEMDTVQNDLITQNTSVKQAQTDIAKLKTDVSGSSTEITSLDNRVESLEDSDVAQSQKISANETSINEINLEIRNLKKDTPSLGDCNVAPDGSVYVTVLNPTLNTKINICIGVSTTNTSGIPLTTRNFTYNVIGQSSATGATNIYQYLGDSVTMLGFTYDVKVTGTNERKQFTISASGGAVTGIYLSSVYLYESNK